MTSSWSSTAFGEVCCPLSTTFGEVCCPLNTTFGEVCCPLSCRLCIFTRMHVRLAADNPAAHECNGCARARHWAARHICAHGIMHSPYGVPIAHVRIPVRAPQVPALARVHTDSTALLAATRVYARRSEPCGASRCLRTSRDRVFHCVPNLAGKRRRCQIPNTKYQIIPNATVLSGSSTGRTKLPYVLQELSPESSEREPRHVDAGATWRGVRGAQNTTFAAMGTDARARPRRVLKKWQLYAVLVLVPLAAGLCGFIAGVKSVPGRSAGSVAAPASLAAPRERVCNAVSVVFAIDGTGSMGDEMEVLTS